MRKGERRLALPHWLKRGMVGRRVRPEAGQLIRERERTIILPPSEGWKIAWPPCRLPETVSSGNRCTASSKPLDALPLS
eukprot:scaffold17242_cov126-Isochrysis_galbana.AAC.4